MPGVNRPPLPERYYQASVLICLGQPVPQHEPLTPKQLKRSNARFRNAQDHERLYTYTVIGSAAEVSVTNALHLLHHYQDLGTDSFHVYDMAGAPVHIVGKGYLLGETFIGVGLRLGPVYYSPGAFSSSPWSVISFDAFTPPMSMSFGRNRGDLIVGGRVIGHTHGASRLDATWIISPDFDIDVVSWTGARQHHTLEAGLSTWHKRVLKISQADRDLPLATKLRLFCYCDGCRVIEAHRRAANPALKSDSAVNPYYGVMTEIHGPKRTEAITGEKSAVSVIIGGSRYSLVRGNMHGRDQSAVNDKTISYAKRQFGHDIELYDWETDIAPIFWYTIVLGIARRMLLNSMLPAKLWYQAVQAAVYTFNLLPQARFAQVPALSMQIHFNAPPDRLPWYSRLIVWGCVAYLPPSPRRLEIARANYVSCEWRRVRFVGYRTVGWLFWDPKTDQIIESPRAVCFENKFESERSREQTKIIADWGI
ncbi:hypothetical protein ACM66B_003170 [Microbotryomycetes sp. NB124-2]